MNKLRLIIWGLALGFLYAQVFYTEPAAAPKPVSNFTIQDACHTTGLEVLNGAC